MNLEEFKIKAMALADQVDECEYSCFSSALVKTREVYTFVYDYILQNKVNLVDTDEGRDLCDYLDTGMRMVWGLCGFFGVSKFDEPWFDFWQIEFCKQKYYRGNWIKSDHIGTLEYIDELVVYLYYRIELLNKSIKIFENERRREN